MTRHRRSNVIRRISDLLLLAGALGVGIWIGSTISMTVYQHWQSYRFEHNRSAQRAEPRQQAPVAVPPRFHDGDIVGRLSIPRLKVNVMIREGTTSPTLAIAVGHIPGTALPGQAGNVGVAGHRDTFFRALRNVKKDDEISFETNRANYTYRVEGTQIVTPEHVEVLKAGLQPELTLVTCYPFYYIGDAPERFIVKARLVSTNGQADTGSIAEKVSASANAADAPPQPPSRHNEVTFDVALGHSRQIIPGKVWLGVDNADASAGTVNGWLWVLPERRTIWLRDTEARQPVVFDQDGRKHELLITQVGHGAAHGFVIEMPNHG